MGDTGRSHFTHCQLKPLKRTSTAGELRLADVPPPLATPLPSRHALLIALFATLLFSSAPSAIRAVRLDAFALGILRLGLASLGMTAVLAWRWPETRTALKQWDGRTTKVFVLVGFTFGVHWLLLFLSIKIGSAAPNRTGMLHAVTAKPADHPVNSIGGIACVRRAASWYFALPLCARSNIANSSAKLSKHSASCAAPARS